MMWSGDKCCQKRCSRVLYQSDLWSLKTSQLPAKKIARHLERSSWYAHHAHSKSFQKEPGSTFKNFRCSGKSTAKSDELFVRYSLCTFLDFVTPCMARILSSSAVQLQNDLNFKSLQSKLHCLILSFTTRKQKVFNQIVGPILAGATSFSATDTFCQTTPKPNPS